MRVEVEDIAGVRLLDGRLAADERGHFAKPAQDSDLDPSAETPAGRQLCSSVNRRAGTVRGLHHQVAPYVEAKLVWCVSGAVWDVVVDLRPEQPTYGDWGGVRLDGESARALRVPPGVAHGFQTLADETVVVYLIDGVHSPAHARTVRWDDPALAVEWPLAVTAISDQDRTAPPWPPAS